MNCRETQQMIDRYLKNNLEESELQAFLDHVRECPSCYEELEIYYTIEYALGYLDNGKKGATNPPERLKEELKDKERVLHRHHLFGMFRTTVIGAALAALVICAGIQIGLVGSAEAMQTTTEGAEQTKGPAEAGTIPATAADRNELLPDAKERE